MTTETPPRVYHETFDHGPGGWIAWLGHNRPVAAEVVDGALISRSPWGIDSNHAFPGGGYLHLLFILFTAPQPNPGPVYGPLLAGNRFIEGGYSTDLRNAKLTVRLKGDVELRGAKLVLHCQARRGDLAINFVLTGQPFEITPDWSEQTITLTTDPDQWLCLGARHDLNHVYGWGEIADVLADVNIDIILLLHPLEIVPLTPEPQGIHHRRPEVDYPVDRTYLPEGYIMLDEVRLEYSIAAIPEGMSVREVHSTQSLKVFNQHITQAGGGAHVSGDASAGRDFIGRDRITIENVYISASSEHRRHGPLHNAPKQPPYYVDRATEYKKLFDLLLASVGGTISLRGAGGYGKTTLAQALCHDPEIITHFPGGIVWIELGESPAELTGRVLGLAAILEPYKPRPTYQEGFDAAKTALQEALGNKQLLLVIDDVWDSAHLAPFLQGGPNCTRLVTTRSDFVLPDKAQRIQIDAMCEEEAIRLLGFGLTPGEQERLKDLADRLGNYPLLLKLAGSALRYRIQERHKTFDETIAYINRALDKDGIIHFDMKHTQDRTKAVALTIQASLNLLDGDEADRFGELAIFPKADDVPLVAVERLWQATAGSDDFDTDQLCERLLRLSLLSRLDDEKKTIRLHDIIHVYLRKQRNDFQNLHGLFLDSYKLDNWTKLSDEEPYLWNHLAFHLIEAGRYNVLRSLFADDRWLQRRLKHDGWIYDGYLLDLNAAWQEAHRLAETEIKGGEAPAAIADGLHFALIRTSINSQMGIYVPELIARTVEVRLWEFPRAYSTAQKIPDAKTRARTLIALLATGQCPTTQTESVLVDAYRACAKISSDTFTGDQDFVFALASLLPYVPTEYRNLVLESALKRISSTWQPWQQITYIKTLAPFLSGSSCEQALKMALGLQDSSQRAEAIAAIAPQLTGSLLEQATAAVLEIEENRQGNCGRALALASLIPQLVDTQRALILAKAIDTTLNIAYEPGLVDALEAIAPYLEGEHREQSLKIARKIRNDYSRTRALVALARRRSDDIDTELISEALEAAKSISVLSFDQRVGAMILVARYLKGQIQRSTLQEALELIVERDTAQGFLPYQMDIVKDLARQLDKELLERAFDWALKIDNGFFRADALAALAPRLNADRAERMLDAAIASQSIREQTVVLTALAPLLDSTQLDQALQSLRAKGEPAMKYYAALACSLTLLTERLSGQERERAVSQALEAAMLALNEAEIGSEIKEVLDALSLLIPLLPETGLKIVYEATKNNKLSKVRVHVSAMLASRLSGELRDNILMCGLEATMNEKKMVRGKPEEIAALAPYLRGEERHIALKAALDYTFMFWAPMPDYLKVLVPCLNPHSDGVLLEYALKQVLSVGFKPDFVSRIAAFLPYLEGDQRRRVIKRCLEVTLSMPDKEKIGEALAKVAPFLDGEFLQQGLDTVLKTEGISYSAKIVEAIAPHLDSESLDNLLTSTLALADVEKRGGILGVLIPHLSSSSLERMLLYMPSIDSVSERWYVFKALVPQIQSNNLTMFLDAAISLESAYYVNWALSELVSHLQYDDRVRVMNRIFDLMIANSGILGLSSIVPYLTSDLLERTVKLVTEIDAIEYPHYHVSLMATLAQQCNENQREDLLQSAFQIALDIKDNWQREHALLSVVNQLSGISHQRAVQELLAIAESEKVEQSKVSKLAALLPHLAPAQRAEKLDEALKLIRSIPHSSYASEAFVKLAPHLEGVFIDRGVELVLELSYHRRSSAIAAITAYYDPKRHVAALQQALNEVLQISNKVPKFEEENKAKALAELAPLLHNSLLQQAFESALTLKNVNARAEALAALIPKLDGEQREQALSLGVSAALSETADNARIRMQALTVLVPKLTDDMLQLALDAVLTVEHDWTTVEPLVAMIPLLSNEQCKMVIDKVLKAADSKESEVDRIVVLAKLMAHLTSEQQTTRLAQILYISKTIKTDNEILRAMVVFALTQILPLLNAEQRKNALELSLNIARSLQNKIWQTASLTALVPYLEDTILAETLALILAARDLHNRASYLAKLLKNSANPSREPAVQTTIATVDPMGHNILFTAARKSFNDTLLNDCQAVSCADLLTYLVADNFVTHLGLNESTLAAIADSVVDIGWHWRWQ